MEDRMQRDLILKSYFSKYLLEIKGVKQSTVNHYLDALNNISRRLVNKGLIDKNIYEIKDIDHLHSVRDILYSDDDFVSMNKRGNHMYTAGMNNYCKFAAGEGLGSVSEKIATLDMPLNPEGILTVERNLPKRSNILRAQALIIANYQCEMDETHESFIAENTKRLYMEGHHAIPMSLQKNFEYSLDIYANLVCLCPICHRRIHYGLKEDRKDMLRHIYNDRGERLANSGINITENEFISLVNE